MEQVTFRILSNIRKEEIMRSTKDYQDLMSELTLFDDLVFYQATHNRKFCEELLTACLGEKVEVLESAGRVPISNVPYREAILDLYCKIGESRYANIEIQNADDGDHERRVRYHASVITARNTDKGTSFAEIPDVIIVYISKKSVHKTGLQKYEVLRMIKKKDGSEMLLDNGLREIYINAEYRDGTDVSTMIDILTTHDVYDESIFPELSAEKKRLIGGDDMTANERLNEWAREERAAGIAEGRAAGIEEERTDVARRLFALGTPLEVVRKACEGLSEEKLEEIMKSI